MNDIANQEELLAAFIEGSVTSVEEAQVREALKKYPELAETYKILCLETEETEDWDKIED